MATYLLIFAAITCVLGQASAQGLDKTEKEGASGSSVVQAVVNRIVAVFGNDNQFLRRVAYVESKDGTDSNTYRSNYHGGIWQVDKVGFQSTQNIRNHPGLTSKHNKTLMNFGIDWSSVQWKDLRKPLYSGLASRLYISNVPKSIPCDIPGQATYWKKYYNRNGSGTEEKFMSDVQHLSQTQGCKVNSDVMFVLDASGSIGRDNFSLVREFVLRYVSRFDIGAMDYQVGVIVFDSIARLEFDFDRYNNKFSLSSAIRNISYSRGGTNIPAALCELHRAYTSNSTGARMDTSVFHIAILMTDGKSYSKSNRCGFKSVSDAAHAVHNITPPVLVFAFGVGSDYDPNDVRVIASGPEYINSAQSFNTSQLDCVQSVQEDNLCNRISTPVNAEAVNSGSLQQGEQIRWQFMVPHNGATFSLKVNQGRVVVYASTKTTAPNDAFYEWTAATSSSSQLRIKPDKGEVTSVSTTIPVYMAFSGVEELNTFSFRSGSSKLEGCKLKMLLFSLLSALLACQILRTL